MRRLQNWTLWVYYEMFHILNRSANVITNEILSLIGIKGFFLQLKTITTLEYGSDPTAYLLLLLV